MTWRYCISRERVPDGLGGESDIFGIREVYYRDDGKIGWSVDEVGPHGDTWDEITRDLALMLGAVNSPILDLTLDPPRLVPPPLKPDE